MKAFVEEDFGTPGRIKGQTVSLEIDGMSVSVPEGTSVMRAAALAGVKVPKLCATDTLEPFGSCRLCLVEVKGRPGTPASCTTLVEPDSPIFQINHGTRYGSFYANRKTG